MTALPPAGPGMKLDQVDTPALIVDLDAFERNLKRMADFAAAAGIRLRPHAKTHKSGIIAQKQIALGAVGVCCQKVSEAEILVAEGVGDVLVSNEIAGARKIERLVALAKKARIGVCVDSIDNARELAQAAERQDVTLSVLLEIDVGGNRCGVAPGKPALALASEIARSNSLHFAGLQAYHGSAQHFRTYEERRNAVEKASALANQTVALLSDAGIDCGIVGGGGTGTFDIEANLGTVNELQAGSYIFMDGDYARNKNADGAAFDRFENALFVLSTVMSRPNDERAVLDAGHKALAVDSGMPEPFRRPGIVYRRPSDEHGVLQSEGGTLPMRGNRLLMVPSHCDPTVNLHDWYVCIRDLHGAAPVVEALWPVSARGCYF
ncbi:DSD1 family PLP-dependent enzyme [Pseudorhodoplanes sp.]|uniref:DSD1 family PLP-dependent enzyme n=1 Tax=Pseudorhodoplanes sp. TaxID=1934341 RepID=UPI003D0AA2D6